MADSRLTDLTAQSVLAVDDVLYSVDVSDTTDNAAGSSRKLPIDRLLGFQGLTPGGRLTLESGVPISTSNQTAKSTLYYTPYVHDWVRLYDGTRLKLYQFTERSLSLTMTSGKNYDVFLYDNSGTLTLELSAAWTNDTTRADAIAWQAGVGWVKSGTATRLWLGTIRASATNQTGISFGDVDVEPFCFVSNFYNEVKAAFRWSDSANSWTYSSSTAQQANANSKAKFSAGSCMAGRLLSATTQSHIGGSGNGGPTLGYDSTTTPYWQVTQSNGIALSTPCSVDVNFGLGYHYLAVLDWSSNNPVTFYGDAGTSFKYSGTHWRWSY